MEDKELKMAEVLAASNADMQGRLKLSKDRRTNIVKDVSEKGYTYLHATRGWKRMSAKRLGAQYKLAQLLGA